MRSLIIDRWFPGELHIKRASGTSDKQTFKAINAMLTMLVQKGRLDLIRAMAEGHAHPMDVYDRYRTEKLDQLPSAETIRLLWTKQDGGMERVGVADEWLAAITTTHRRHSVRYSWAALKRLPGASTATLASLPAMMQEYRKRCVRDDRPAMFANARNNVRALLRDTVGVTHPLYLAVKEIRVMDRDRKSGRPFTRTTLPSFLEAMRAAHGPHYEAVARSLALSGMRPEEYWSEWEAVSDTVVRIRNAKQRNGKKNYRRVFTVAPLVRPEIARRTFEDKMREVTRAHQCYDLRRTFMHLMEQARVPRSRRMYYLGHSAGDVSGRYEEHEVDEYLASDRTKLKRYLSPSRPPTPPESHRETTGMLQVYDEVGESRHTRTKSDSSDADAAPELRKDRNGRGESPELSPACAVAHRRSA